MLPGEYFEFHKKSVNGSYYHVTAKQKGKTLLTATLDAIAVRMITFACYLLSLWKYITGLRSVVGFL